MKFSSTEKLFNETQKRIIVIIYFIISAKMLGFELELEENSPSSSK